MSEDREYRLFRIILADSSRLDIGLPPAAYAHGISGDAVEFLMGGDPVRVIAAFTGIQGWYEI